MNQFNSTEVATTDNEVQLINEIKAIKEELGCDLLIVAHHYVKKEIVELANIVGDSYKLALDVSRQNAKYIIFCGVMFMGEGAATLAKDYQRIYLPNWLAGCPMADMISAQKARAFSDFYTSRTKREIVPLVYMNSNLETKAFVGEKNGSVCTSSNAKKIVSFYINRNMPIFFFPDKNLGFNTARELGLKSNEALMVLESGDGYSFVNMDGQLCDNLDEAKIIMWHGYCPIHHAFLTTQFEDKKNNITKEAYLLVHPEVEMEVAAKADFIGSTQAIENHIKKLAKDPDFSTDKKQIIIGTEATFVKRLSGYYNLDIVPLEDIACVNMKKITISDLHKIIIEVRNFAKFGGKEPKVVSVSNEVKNNAAIALKNMIEIAES